MACSRGGRGSAEANHEYPPVGFGNDPIQKRLGSSQLSGVVSEAMGATNKAALEQRQGSDWNGGGRPIEHTAE